MGFNSGFKGLRKARGWEREKLAVIGTEIKKRTNKQMNR